MTQHMRDNEADRLPEDPEQQSTGARPRLALVPKAPAEASPLSAALRKTRDDARLHRRGPTSRRESTEDVPDLPVPRPLGSIMRAAAAAAAGAKSEDSAQASPPAAPSSPSAPAVMDQSGDRERLSGLPPTGVSVYSITAGDEILFVSPGFRASLTVPKGTREDDPEGWDAVAAAANKAVADLIRGYAQRQTLIATFSTEGAREQVDDERLAAVCNALTAQMAHLGFLRSLVADQSTVTAALAKISEGLEEILDFVKS